MFSLTKDVILLLKVKNCLTPTKEVGWVIKQTLVPKCPRNSLSFYSDVIKCRVYNFVDSRS